MGTILGFFQVESWAAVVTAITTVVTAWLEFSSTQKKLERYSDTIHQIAAIVLWWESLTDVNPPPSHFLLPATQCHMSIHSARGLKLS